MIQGIGIAKSVINAVKKKPLVQVGVPPKPPERGGGASGEGWKHPQFSEEDEKLIAEFRTPPLKTPATTTGFFNEYQASINGFFKTRKQQDWERLTAFFFKHSSYARELNDAGVKEVSRRLAEHVKSYGCKSLVPSALAGSYRTVREYLKSAPIKPGDSEHNAMESAMRQAPVVSDAIFSVVKDSVIAELKRDPRFRKGQ